MKHDIIQAIERLQGTEADYWFAIDKKPEAAKDVKIVIDAFKYLDESLQRIKNQLEQAQAAEIL